MHSTHVAGAVASRVKLDLVDHEGANAGFIDQTLEVMNHRVQTHPILFTSPPLFAARSCPSGHRHSDR